MPLFVAFAILPAMVLTGCARKPEIKVEKEYVPVPTIVATGCIAPTGRPDRVKPIKDRVSREAWVKLAPGAKSQAITAQAGERMNYEDQDRAATSGCN